MAFMSCISRMLIGAAIGVFAADAAWADNTTEIRIYIRGRHGGFLRSMD